eukprot:8608334-Pyramimonas_sp.AAC.1
MARRTEVFDGARPTSISMARSASAPRSSKTRSAPSRSKESKRSACHEVRHWAGDRERSKTRKVAIQKPKGSGRGAGRGRAGGFLART